MKKGKGPIPPSGLLSAVQYFNETGSLFHRTRSGAQRLSEVRTSAVASQMDTLSKVYECGKLHKSCTEIDCHSKDIGTPLSFHNTRNFPF